MQKTFCDRCDKELGERGTNRFYWSMTRWLPSKNHRPPSARERRGHHDYCNSCADEVAGILKGAIKKKR